MTKLKHVFKGRQTIRQTDKQQQTISQIVYKSKNQVCRQTDKQTTRQANLGQTNIQRERHSDFTDNHTNRQPDIQKNKQTRSQTISKIDSKKDNQTKTDKQ